MSERVHPQLGADELLLRLDEWVRKQGGFNLFQSGQVCLEFGLPRKLCSNTLGRLFNRGDLTRKKLTRLDRYDTRRGICYVYNISRKGESRLRYLKNRQSLPSRAMALAGDPAKLLGLTLLGPFVEKYGPSEFTRLSKKRPMLDSFAVIDADIRAAAPMIKLWAQETNLALAISLYLKRRGLIPQQEDLTFIVQNGKSHGLSDEEIITNLLFAGALWLKKQKDDLEAECDKLKTESSTRGQLLDLVPQMLDVARPIG